MCVYLKLVTQFIPEIYRYMVVVSQTQFVRLELLNELINVGLQFSSARGFPKKIVIGRQETIFLDLSGIENCNMRNLNQYKGLITRTIIFKLSKKK